MDSIRKDKPNPPPPQLTSAREHLPKCRVCGAEVDERASCCWLCLQYLQDGSRRERPARTTDSGGISVVGFVAIGCGLGLGWSLAIVGAFILFFLKCVESLHK
jgi:hypothetical protein